MHLVYVVVFQNIHILKKSMKDRKMFRENLLLDNTNTNTKTKSYK